MQFPVRILLISVLLLANVSLCLAKSMTVDGTLQCGSRGCNILPQDDKIKLNDVPLTPAVQKQVDNLKVQPSLMEDKKYKFEIEVDNKGNVTKVLKATPIK